MESLKHIIKYGTAVDTQFIKEYKETFDLLALNANILCFQSENMARNIYVEFKNLPYFIDPKLYVFQNDLKYIKKDKSDEFRQSYITLAKNYGLDYVIDKDSSLTIQEVKMHGIETLTKDILKFQIDYIYENLSTELKQFAMLSNTKKEPSFLNIPSFTIKDIKVQDWLNINIQMIEESMKLKKASFNNKEMYANLIISKDSLNSKELIDQIIEKYSLADGLLFWIDGFNELKVDEETIMSLIYFIQKYKKLNPNKNIYSLYGGYFSQLLNKIGLSGVTHGVGYGESKDINTIGGVPSVQKYYMPKLFQRMTPEAIIKLLNTMKLSTKHDFYEKVCDCAICQHNIYDNNIDLRFFIYLDDTDSSKNLRSNSRINCTKHYLEVKHIEFTKIRSSDTKTLINNLKYTFDSYVKNNYANSSDISYLMRWYSSLLSISDRFRK